MPEHTNQSGDNDPPESWPPRLANEHPTTEEVWKALGPIPIGLIAHEKFDMPNASPGGDSPIKMWSLLWQSRHNTAAGPPAGGPIMRNPT